MFEVGNKLDALVDVVDAYSTILRSSNLRLVVKNHVLNTLYFGSNWSERVATHKLDSDYVTANFRIRILFSAVVVESKTFTGYPEIDTFASTLEKRVLIPLTNVPSKRSLLLEKL